jgi:hypothetical protein
MLPTTATRKENTMKSLEEQLSILRESCRKAGHFDFPKNAPTVEQTLSETKKFMQAHSISESTGNRISRNNGKGGSVFTESTDNKTTERIKRYAERAGVSLREAASYVTGRDVYKFGEPGSKTFELAESWKKYCRSLTEQEIESLIARGVKVPKF